MGIEGGTYGEGRAGIENINPLHAHRGREEQNHVLDAKATKSITEHCKIRCGKTKCIDLTF